MKSKEAIMLLLVLVGILIAGFIAVDIKNEIARMAKAQQVEEIEKNTKLIMARTFIMSMDEFLQDREVNVNKRLTTQSENKFVYVLDNNDPDYSNPPFNDTLFIINTSSHEVVNTISGFNTCETVGGWRVIAAYIDGTCVVAEIVADRLSRWDAQGSCIFSIDMDIHAIDVSNDGYIYALTSGSGTIYGNTTVILDGYGNIIKEAPFGGIDIAVDDTSNSVWVVGADIKRLDKNLALLFSIDPIDWAAVSVDYTSDGKAWIAERYYYGERGRLICVSLGGDIIKEIELPNSPSCLSVDRTDDSIWVSTSGKLYKFSSNGTKILEIDSGKGWSVKVDNSDRSVWLAGYGYVRHYTKNGTLISSISGFSSSQAYIAEPVSIDWNPWDDSDSEGGECVTTAELQEAIHCWLNDLPAPETNAEITTERLQEVIHLWLNC